MWVSRAGGVKGSSEGPGTFPTPWPSPRQGHPSPPSHHRLSVLARPPSSSLSPIYLSSYQQCALPPRLLEYFYISRLPLTFYPRHARTEFETMLPEISLGLGLGSKLPMPQEGLGTPAALPGVSRPFLFPLGAGRCPCLMSLLYSPPGQAFLLDVAGVGGEGSLPFYPKEVAPC